MVLQTYGDTYAAIYTPSLKENILLFRSIYLGILELDSLLVFYDNK